MFTLYGRFNQWRSHLGTCPSPQKKCKKEEEKRNDGLITYIFALLVREFCIQSGKTKLYFNPVICQRLHGHGPTPLARESPISHWSHMTLHGSQNYPNSLLAIFQFVDLFRIILAFLSLPIVTEWGYCDTVIRTNTCDTRKNALIESFALSSLSPTCTPHHHNSKDHHLQRHRYRRQHRNFNNKRE